MIENTNYFNQLHVRSLQGFNNLVFSMQKKELEKIKLLNKVHKQL